MKALAEREEGLLEWQTKVLAVYVSATAMDGGKKLIDSAMKISLRGGADETASTVQDARANDPSIYVEQGSQVAENRTGSFEKLLGGFGGKGQNR